MEVWELNVDQESRRNKPERPDVRRHILHPAPYIHDHSDSRCYRPEVTVDKRQFGVTQPASVTSRTMVDVKRGTQEHGWRQKLEANTAESSRSHRQMRANFRDSQKSEVGETLHGNGRTIDKPILYPQGLNHQMALALEKKAEPGLPFDKRPPTANEPFEKWSQEQHLPYSRTRSHFKLE
uniref:Uncharacterized protein n=1 Tax=Octactis speculum TaxID=3111310 RepID=A0A7S2C742_9STRA|mmetsp:Transcript_32429/g.43884  ORF Transcript_32429/g.43884 Transcript_32429/m.43884 type:complete len:180 (+) Transcript_32429:3-542(+)